MVDKAGLLDGVSHIAIDKLSYSATEHGDVVVTTLSVEYMAREFAGTFFEQNRSKKFRAIWGTSDKQQNRYVDNNWKTFIAPARQVMAQMLGMASVPQDQKDQIYDALCQDNLIQQVSRGGASGIMQIEPGSEAFEGEKSLNADIDSGQVN